jgi:hypothetical protein
LTLSGKDGSDADRYQEKDVKNALRDLENLHLIEDYQARDKPLPKPSNLKVTVEV